MFCIMSIMSKSLCRPLLWLAWPRNFNLLQNYTRSNSFHHHHLTTSSLVCKSGWPNLQDRHRPAVCACQLTLPPCPHDIYASVHNGRKYSSGKFSTTKRTAISNSGMTDETYPMAHREDSGPTADTGWVIRLANENGYLSWCRNTYLATVIGVAMWAEGPSTVALYGAEGAFFIGGLNLMCGTLSYLNTIVRLRRKLHMSLMGAGLHVIGALSHVILWITIVVTYLGHVEAVEEQKHKGDITETETADIQQRNVNQPR